jgi:hypothetical protein
MMPSAPPAPAISRLSVSSCRIRRPRAAPSDRRSANSRRRAIVRDSSSTATLAHAISSTTPTIAIISSSASP